MALGNGRWITALFNERLQPTDMRLGSTAQASDLWRLQNSYGTTVNNGNMQGQTLNPTASVTVNQAYLYDGINRLYTRVCLKSGVNPRFPFTQSAASCKGGTIRGSTILGASRLTDEIYTSKPTPATRCQAQSRTLQPPHPHEKKKLTSVLRNPNPP